MPLPIKSQHLQLHFKFRLCCIFGHEVHMCATKVIDHCLLENLRLNIAFCFRALLQP